MRFVSIATAGYRSQAERLVRSLRRAHPDAEIELHVDDPAGFAGLEHLTGLVALPEIGELGVKRAKFVMYRRAGERGPFVYLDADIVVLDTLEELLAGDGLTACADDLSGCPFIPDKRHPWPGDATLTATRYVNSGVLGFGRAVLDRLESWEARALDDAFWYAHIHPDGLYDNHVLCALLELDDVPVRFVPAEVFNWQGYRDAEAGVVAEVRDGRLVHGPSGQPLRLVHFAGFRDVDAHLMGVPFEIAAVIDEASMVPLSPTAALAHLRAGAATSMLDATHEARVVAHVMIQATAHAVDRPASAVAFVGDPVSVVSAALSIPPDDVTWNGLRCGGAYLEAREYVALRDLCHHLDVSTVLETGAGETTRLFARTVSRVASLEPTAGPWFDRARDAGADVRLAPFRPGVGFDPDVLADVLTRLADRTDVSGEGGVDLLFVDSPIGGEARRTALAQVLERVRPSYVVAHDARRDALALLSALPTGCYRVHSVVDSFRGLVVLAHESAPDPPPSAAPPIADDHRVAIEVLGSVRSVGGGARVRIRVRNTSDGSWPVDGPTPVRLSYHVHRGDEVVVFDGVRTELPCRVDPDDELELDLLIDATGLPPGDLIVEPAVVHEGVTWFGPTDGRCTVDLTIAEVDGESFDEGAGR